MKKQICLITGATEGVGKETAKALALKGFIVVLVARNAAKAELVKQEIVLSLPGAQVDYIIADLASLEQIHRLADVFRQRYDHLDILINNAGIFSPAHVLTIDGYESTYQVNYLSQFFLTNLLLTEIKKSNQGRIINLSSNVFTMGKFDEINLQSEKYFSAIKTYANSKLLIMMFTTELSERLLGTGVTVNAVHPGIVRTQMMLSAKGLFRVLSYIALPFSISPEKGALTSVYLATSDFVKNISGKYFTNSKVAKANSKFNTKKNREILWNVSIESLTKSKGEYDSKLHDHND